MQGALNTYYDPLCKGYKKLVFCDWKWTLNMKRERSQDLKNVGKLCRKSLFYLPLTIPRWNSKHFWRQFFACCVFKWSLSQYFERFCGHLPSTPFYWSCNPHPPSFFFRSKLPPWSILCYQTLKNKTQIHKDVPDRNRMQAGYGYGDQRLVALRRKINDICYMQIKENKIIVD